MSSEFDLDIIWARHIDQTQWRRYLAHGDWTACHADRGALILEVSRLRRIIDAAEDELDRERGSIASAILRTAWNAA